MWWTSIMLTMWHDKSREYQGRREERKKLGWGRSSSGALSNEKTEDVRGDMHGFHIQEAEHLT